MIELHGITVYTHIMRNKKYESILHINLLFFVLAMIGLLFEMLQAASGVYMAGLGVILHTPYFVILCIILGVESLFLRRHIHVYTTYDTMLVVLVLLRGALSLTPLVVSLPFVQLNFGVEPSPILLAAMCLVAQVPIYVHIMGTSPTNKKTVE